MIRNLSLFPILNESLKEELNCHLNNLNFKYLDEDELIEIEIEDIYEDELSVTDNAGVWNPDEYNLQVSGVLSIGNVFPLFGDSGIASDESKLGIGIVVKSKTSNTRKAIPLVTFVKHDFKLDVPFCIEFSKSEMRGKVELSWVIYVAEAKDEGHYAKKPGTLLGELASKSLILEGIGSYFTIFEKDMPKEPLWNVVCNWIDPSVDSFCDNVLITLNTAHKAYPMLQDEQTRTELLKEIIASAMQIVISKIDSSLIDGTEEYEEGSVAQAVAYMKEKADLAIDSQESIALTLRKYLDKTMR